MLPIQCSKQKESNGYRYVNNGLRLCISCLFALAFVLTSCKKEATGMSDNFLVEKATQENLTEQNNGTITESRCFSAIAQVDGCTNNEWIRFSGWIEWKENVTTSSDGSTHITRHFTVKDLTAVGVNIGATLTAMTCSGTLNGTTTGTEYEVLGGAEMFAIHFTEGGSATLGSSTTFIHRGTLVFVNKETGQRVIAKHVIQKANGVIKANSWECSGN